MLRGQRPEFGVPYAHETTSDFRAWIFLHQQALYRTWYNGAVTHSKRWKPTACFMGVRNDEDRSYRCGYYYCAKQNGTCIYSLTLGLVAATTCDASKNRTKVRAIHTARAGFPLVNQAGYHPARVNPQGTHTTDS